METKRKKSFSGRALWGFGVGASDLAEGSAGAVAAGACGLF